MATLRSFGFGRLDVTAQDFSRENQVVQLGVPPNRIDLITSVTGVTFDAAWGNRENGDIDNIPVSFIGFEDLILNKETAARPKDLGDADALRKRRPR